MIFTASHGPIMSWGIVWEVTFPIFAMAILTLTIIIHIINDQEGAI